MKLLSGEEAAQAVVSLAHRYASFDPAVEKMVAGIVNHVRTGGDAALLEYAHKFDGLAKGASMRVSAEELQASLGLVSDEFIRAIEIVEKTFATLPSGNCPVRGFARFIQGCAWVRQSVRWSPWRATLRAGAILCLRRC